MKKGLTCILMGCLCVLSYAQTSLERSDLGVPSLIAPKYFGPNAFPVPDFPCVPGLRTIEIAGDCWRGSLVNNARDYTFDAFIRASFPLFCDRANLTVWMPVCEVFSFDDAVADSRRLSSQAPRSGSECGDVYISTDILILREKTSHLDLVLRAALKTASGGQFISARYYDAAGYFFDATAYKSFPLDAKNASLRLGASAGFLCWQTNNARQNDAVQYGISATFISSCLDIDTCLSGYMGWEGDGDAPLSFKCSISGKRGRVLKPFVYLQQGLIDYPYFQIRLGVKHIIG